MSNEGKELMDPALFAQLLENQRQELALKEKEIDLEREKIRAAQKSNQMSVSCFTLSNNLRPRSGIARTTELTGRHWNRRASSCSSS